MNTEQKLNSLIETHYSFDMTTLPLLSLDFGDPTIIPKEEVAFTLKPIAGMITEKVPVLVEIDNALLQRMVISYSLATKMVKDVSLFHYVMSCYLNTALKSLARYRKAGTLVFDKIHLKRPGTPNTYVRDMENSAAYELRLFVEKRGGDEPVAP